MKYLQYTAGFYFYGKIFAYIDGFNSYHCLKNAIENKNTKLIEKNKWINYRKLISLFFGKNDNIDKIMFFSAIPYHLSKDKIKKHKLYYEILTKYCNIEVANGRFGEKFIDLECKYCGKTSKRIKKHEEKETDVAVAINILYDALTVEDLDTIVIISADTDFIPIIEMILEKTNKKIKMLFPINSKINNKFQKIKNNNYKSKSIKETHIIKSQIPDIVNINGKTYKTPY